MFNYGVSQSIRCPIPEANLLAQSPTNPSLARRVNAIVDTGAEMTCVPRAIIERLGDLEYDRINVRSSAHNTAQSRRTSIIDIQIDGCHFSFSDIEVIEIDNNFAIIGRDILNELRLILDGPQQEWSIDFQDDQ